jgi:glutaredoxin
MNLIHSFKKFFSSKFNIALVIILIALGAIAFINTTETAPNNVDSDSIEVHFFYAPTCPHCTEQKPIYYDIKEERTDVSFFEHDASSQDGSALFYKMAKEADMDTSRLGVPTLFIGKHVLVGLQSRENILSAIDECINECTGEEYQSEDSQGIEEGFNDFEIPFIGRTDLTAWSLPILAVVLGFIDGFNPCALWVLIFIITLLLGERDKKKIWLVVGSFVFASAVSYFLFMTAWLNFFLLMGYIKLVTILIGMFAVGAGVLHIRDWILTKGEVVCNVTDAKSRKKTMDKIKDILSKPVTIGVILSIVGLAFMVNAIEFVCSAAIPAVFTQLLAISDISTFQHYMYISLYVLFYMLIHIIIFSMAAFALSSGLAEKYAKYCKLIGGLIMFLLGMMLLFAPHLLR